MIRGLLTFGAGALFGAGLSVSHMVDPKKVLAFLDVAGNWDPSLAFVMLGALMVTLVSFRFILKRPAPLLDNRFRLPQKTAIDRSLLLGALLFGSGWGISGYCPGPAIASLGFGWLEPVVMVLSIVAGMLVHQRLFSEPKPNPAREEDLEKGSLPDLGAGTGR
jgi:uncharacterized membrane protein YedE/YeeE